MSIWIDPGSNAPVKWWPTKSINDVLLLETSEGELKFGNPIVEGVSVEVEIVRTFKGKKVIIFKKRRRQNSRRKKGHRQLHTEIRIKSIQV